MSYLALGSYLFNKILRVFTTSSLLLALLVLTSASLEEIIEQFAGAGSEQH